MQTTTNFEKEIKQNKNWFGLDGRMREKKYMHTVNKYREMLVRMDGRMGERERERKINKREYDGTDGWMDGI
jgi:hypothetical protein